jgi:hypothetical protein
VPTNCSTRKSAQTEAVSTKEQDQAKEKKLLKQLTPPLNKVLAPEVVEICFKSTYKRYVYQRSIGNIIKMMKSK